ncbi:hypothetical protein LCGC14_1382470 [marine sediment metagenome]|uniref:Uncharacterized protein n=1 Tax=marine sediment metagenome TaxID=412755 RepID=A0A0F9MHQ6_9ZZZZ
MSDQEDTDALILELRAVNEAVMDRAVDYIRDQRATITELERKLRVCDCQCHLGEGE